MYSESGPLLQISEEWLGTDFVKPLATNPALLDLLLKWQNSFGSDSNRSPINKHRGFAEIELCLLFVSLRFRFQD